MFPNFPNPMSRNTQGKQSIPRILVLCFLSAWIKALASHSCKLQQEVGEHLAFSKSEVQGCWLLKWNSGIVIRIFKKFYLIAEISTPAQFIAMWALSSRVTGTALVKLRVVCWSTSSLTVPCLSLQDYFPMIFSLFSTLPLSTFLIIL